MNRFQNTLTSLAGSLLFAAASLSPQPAKAQPVTPFSNEVLRGYQPKSDLLDGRFRVPGVERVE